MVLVHGFGCDQSVWRYITPGLLDTYKIVLIDQVGVGDSDCSGYNSGKYASLEAYAADILEVYHELNLQDAILVGHSVGATLCILCAIQEPDRFSELILLVPSPCYINDGDYYGGFERADVEAMLATMQADYEGWATTYAPFIMGNPDCPSLEQDLEELFCRANQDIAKEFARITFLSDYRPMLSKLTNKTLLLQCTEDTFAPPRVGAFIHEAIPTSMLLTLGATGHCPHLSAPIETLSAISAFLQQPRTMTDNFSSAINQAK
ncbi:alpha/beta fold hydrolase [Hymenobacter roseosalivarius]|nr:alpha/beta hydrolase [Hymenobacter roseosalivarius]